MNKFGISYAFINWIEFNEYIYIDFICVEEEYRRHRLGTELMYLFIMQHATKPIRLTVVDAWGVQYEILEHFYAQLGFKYVDAKKCMMERPAGAPSDYMDINAELADEFTVRFDENATILDIYF